MINKHIPVLLNKSIEMLNIKSDGIYVDCTLGRGGHSSEILKRLSDKGKLYCIDQDQTAIDEGKERLEKISSNFEIIKGNFKDIKALLALKGVFKVDGILYDLGVSSPQFDVPERGFSYRFDGPLDMRMDQSSKLSASTVVNEFSEQNIADIIFKYGDERYSRQIAKEIVKARPINTTLELVDVIKKALPEHVLKEKGHPAKKTFQALRVYVNQEMDVLQKSLEQSLDLLNPKGRICVITFQSQEEKIVKDLFKAKTVSKKQQVLNSLPMEVADPDIKFNLITKSPIKPSKDELLDNNRAHSSKLWVIEKK